MDDDRPNDLGNVSKLHCDRIVVVFCNSSKCFATPFIFIIYLEAGRLSQGSNGQQE